MAPERMGDIPKEQFIHYVAHETIDLLIAHTRWLLEDLTPQQGARLCKDLAEAGWEFFCGIKEFCRKRGYGKEPQSSN